MASRPRRSAAARAQENITVQSRLADTSDKGHRAIMSFRKTGQMPSAMVSRDPPSSPGGDSHLSVTVKVPSTKLRQATMTAGRRFGQFEGGEIVHGKRNRGGKKSYVVDSSPDVEDDDEEEEEAEIEEDEEEEEDLDVDDGEDDEDENEDVHEPEDEDMEDQDAEGEDEMDVDAEGDVDVAVPSRVPGPVIKVSRPTKIKPILRVPSATKPIQPKEEQDGDDDDDDDELSEPAESDLGDETLGYGDETMADEDAEGEEIEVAGDEDDDEDDEEEDEEEVEVEEAEEPEEDEEEVVERASHKSAIARRAANRVSDDEPDSEDEGSRDETPDLAKMTKRQRARFEDAPQEYMKLSDEIQVKKVFTAEELSMRRQEMARRRRNLSEKRNEEVKMETINKLLKKQAPKINRKTAMAADGRTDSLDNEGQKPSPFFIRWVSNKNGSQVAVPQEILEGPVGRVFGDKAGTISGKMVEEVV